MQAGYHRKLLKACIKVQSHRPTLSGCGTRLSEGGTGFRTNTRSSPNGPDRCRFESRDAFTYGHFKDRSPQLPEDKTAWAGGGKKAAASRRTPKFAVLPCEYSNK